MFCRKCGNQLHDDDCFCKYCGTKTNYSACEADYGDIRKKKTKDIVKTLSVMEFINGILWIIIAVLQLIFGLYSIYCGWIFHDSYTTHGLILIVVGVFNLIGAILDLRFSNSVLKYPIGIISRYDSPGGLIRAFIYNLVVGSWIGVIGCFYSFYIMYYVLKREEEYLKIQGEFFKSNSTIF